MGQALRLEVILLSKEKAAAPPTQAPRQASREVLREASRQVSRQASRQASRRASRRASRHREANPPKPSKPSTPFKTLQTPSPTGTPGPRPLLNQAPQGQGHSNGFLLAFKAAVCQPANTPNAPKPSKRSKTLQTPSKTLQTLQAWRHALSRWPKGYGS